MADDRDERDTLRTERDALMTRLDAVREEIQALLDRLSALEEFGKAAMEALESDRETLLCWNGMGFTRQEQQLQNERYKESPEMKRNAAALAAARKVLK